MKWVSHCISLMSGILTAQYHRLVTVPTLGTSSDVPCKAWEPFVPPAARVSHAASSQLSPSLSITLGQRVWACPWCHFLPGFRVQKPINVEIRWPGSLASSLHSSEGSSQLSVSYGIHWSRLGLWSQLHHNSTFPSTQSHSFLAPGVLPPNKPSAC